MPRNEQAPLAPMRRPGCLAGVVLLVACAAPPSGPPEVPAGLPPSPPAQSGVSYLGRDAGGTHVITSGFGAATSVQAGLAACGGSADCWLATGVDHETGADWDAVQADPVLGDVYFTTSPGTAADRWVGFTPGGALRYFVHTATQPGGGGFDRGRVQLNVFDNVGLQGVNYGVDVLLPLDALRSYPYAKGDWLMLAEFWPEFDGGDQGATNAFRVSVYVVPCTDAVPHELCLGVLAQTMDPAPGQTCAGATYGYLRDVWQQLGAPLDLGAWLHLDVLYVMGDATTGRFRVITTNRVTQDSTTLDVTNFTRHPCDPAPAGLKKFNPLKLYLSKPLLEHVKQVSGQGVSVYFDNFELWRTP